MHIWQLCHLGMVVPLADAYYQTENPESVGQDQVIMRKTATQLKKNFYTLYKNLNTLSPGKMHIFRFLSDSNVIMSQCIQVDNVPIGTLSTCRVKL